MSHAHTNNGGFSWKRAIGISRVRNAIARKTGIPTTRDGRQRKMGRLALHLLLWLVLAAIAYLVATRPDLVEALRDALGLG